MDIAAAARERGGPPLISIIHFPLITTFLTTVFLLYAFYIYPQNAQRISFLFILLQLSILMAISILQVVLVYLVLVGQKIIFTWDKGGVGDIFASIIAWTMSLAVIWSLRASLWRIFPSFFQSTDMRMLYIALIHGSIWSLGISGSLSDMPLWQGIVVTLLGIPGGIFSFILLEPLRSQLALEETWHFMGEKGLLIISCGLMAMPLIYVDFLLSLQLVGLFP